MVSRRCVIVVCLFAACAVYTLVFSGAAGPTPWAGVIGHRVAFHAFRGSGLRLAGDTRAWKERGYIFSSITRNLDVLPT
ncbi:hypothetical protein B0I37DRAFT_359928, partial [Chaetomium sp. MPI-CAGE-AT-0009]